MVGARRAVRIPLQEGEAMRKPRPSVKVRLREQLERLKGEFARGREALIERSPDSADEAQAEAIETVAFGAQDQAWRLRTQVVEALDRLDHGSYGLCQRCGGTIARKRLDALPWAALCVECQSDEDEEPFEFSGSQVGGSTPKTRPCVAAATNGIQRGQGGG
jgi:DnaK suppressor protein